MVQLHGPWSKAALNSMNGVVEKCMDRGSGALYWTAGVKGEVHTTTRQIMSYGGMMTRHVLLGCS